MFCLTQITQISQSIHRYRSYVPLGRNKQQAALLYADKPAVVASDAHFASATKSASTGVSDVLSVKSVESV